MGIIADKIDWFRNGERANSDNFNRPLEQLVNEIETRLINEDGSITSSSSKQVFDISEKGNIDNGNIVYMDVSGKIEKAIADGSEKSKALGVAVIANNLDGQETLSVVSSGVVQVTNKVLEIGRVYYLSDNVEGDYSTTPSDAMIGIALKTDLLLVSIQGTVAEVAVADVIDDTQTNLTKTWSSQHIDNKINTAVADVIDDTQTNLTKTWSSQLIDTKLSTAVAGVIDDNQITSTLTWSSVKISAEIGQGGGGTASIDDNTISLDKVWSSFKTNEMVKGGRTISVNNLETAEGSGDTTITNTTANAKMVNLSVKVKTNSTANKYLGDVVVYYNDPSKEILRQSCVSQNITGTTDLTSAMGMTILDAQDSLIIKSAPASGVQDFWNNVSFIKSTSNVTGSAPEPEPLGEGVIFTAQASSSSVTFNKQGTPTELQLEYQTTLSDVTSGWQDYTLGTTIDLNPNDKVSFRNKGTQSITQTTANYHYFTMAGEIKAENDLTYLFDGAGGVDTIAEYGCYKMFSNCDALTEMPNLSASNIGANGYANMFEGCTKLKTIKPLNATTLANYSYKEMFKNCSGLIISEGSGENQFLSMPAGAPSNAGDNMFLGTGGRFIGTPTASNSYFYNATLPATTMLRFTAEEAGSTIMLDDTAFQMILEYNLAENGVESGWKTYPRKNIITLKEVGDYVEFRNQGLQHPSLLAGNRNEFVMTGKIAASGNIMYLLDKTGELIEFVNRLEINGLFDGCSSLTTAPELPATKLTDGCYDEFFRGCTNLRTAPSILPAEDLDVTTTYGVYESMFMDCQSLTTPPVISATKLGKNCFNNMFSGCRALTTTPKLPVTELKDFCYSWMFSGCSSLMTATLLPATSLANGCYSYMFSGCSNLKITNTQQAGATTIFTCPNTSGLTDPVKEMFRNTGGTFTGTPTTGNTYNWYN